MASKTNGATFKAFMNDGIYWTNRFYDEDEITVNGETIEFDETYGNVDDSAVVIIKEGFVDAEEKDEDDNFDGISLTTFFNRWLKMQNTIMVTVTMDRSREAEFRALMKANGFKV